MTDHPYRGRDARTYWNTGVTGSAPHLLDPVVEPRLAISENTVVATMGSCFAQHVAAHLRKLQLSVLDAEPPPDGMSDHEARRRQYCIYSARYGNVYTLRQAVQLFDRAFGALAPAEDVWSFGGGFADPVRPYCEPDGFPTIDDLCADRQRHLAAVRRVFESADVLVFTMGLTEAWRSRIDGAVFGAAPGVHGGSFDRSRHAFVNFSVADVSRDLDHFVERIAAVNPGARVMLTVSPVPLAATWEDRHVLVSTTASKAILRAAADGAVRRHANVDYFPSFEIITAPGNGHYYADDLREVTPAGVTHVMRVFARHYVVDADRARQGIDFVDEGRSVSTIVCDEERLGEAAPSADVSG